jgi:hypothetical protein
MGCCVWCGELHAVNMLKKATVKKSELATTSYLDVVAGVLAEPPWCGERDVRIGVSIAAPDPTIR